MEIQEQTQGAVRIVRPVGPLTSDSAGEVARHVRKLTPGSLGRLVLDLSEVPYVDSLGIEALLEASDALSELGLSLRLCGTNPTVSEVLRITNQSGAFEFHPDAQSGVRSFL